MFRTTIFLLLVQLFAAVSSAQDRAGAIGQFRSLNAAPGSLGTTTLPPDGRPWIVFIFKACCSPSDHAARWIVDAEKQFGDRIGIIGLNVDPGKSLPRVSNWLHTHQIEFPVVSDPTAQVAIAWGVIAPPAVVILDGQAHEIYRTMGYQPSYGHKLTAEIHELLKSNTTDDKR
ncbi:MAG: TlpA disulfide reductase family protein [Candidatus Electryonea clarkiae]|nr:TlpA disulfide reductase family protein [Candidatus Electryonea clarkiae]MDP8286238.1 TlpA disulfide reductase family protein [Candidatus Electryonea clarkiae]